MKREQSTVLFLVRAWRSTLRVLVSTLPPAAKKTVIAACLLAAVLIWCNSRILAVRVNQSPEKPLVLSAYPVFHGMAAALEQGRLGQLDLTRYRHYLALGNPNEVYKRFSGDGPPEFVDYYSLDIGYSFIVEVARLAFPTLPDNHQRALALQLLVDLGMVFLLYALFAQWDAVLGALAALFYAGNKVFCGLASFAFYYYWDVPLTFTVFGLLLLSYRRPARATQFLAVAGFALGFGTWVRSSWWPIAFFLLGLTLLTPVLRRKVLVGLAVFAIVAGPQIYRSSRARGHLALSTRATWQMALAGLGYYPNPYGLEAKDETIMYLMRDKYGVVFRMEDLGDHDQAAREEFLSVLHKDPRFVLRSFLGRLWESACGTTQTSMVPYLLLSNPGYRGLCLLGFVLMVVQGGERRWLALLAAGTWALYVGLSSLFYFVGAAHDNVSQVSLFVVFMGLLDAGQRAIHRTESWVR